MRDSGRDAQPIAHCEGKGPIPPDNVDTPVDNELSSGSSLSLNPSPTKNTRESTRTRSRKRPSPHPAFSDAISNASYRVRRETSHRQYRSSQASRNPAYVALRHIAISTTRTSCLWYSSNLLPTIDYSNLKTRRHALFTLGATHP